jgi:glycerol uptake facilitator-like aquaporin
MQKLLVELVGTSILVLVILTTGNWAFIGLTLAVLVFLGGKISGGAYNPAVALSLYMNKTLSFQDFGMYALAELLGAVIAVFIYQQMPKLKK